jgi:hypothetical protein
MATGYLGKQSAVEVRKEHTPEPRKCPKGKRISPKEKNTQLRQGSLMSLNICGTQNQRAMPNKKERIQQHRNHKPAATNSFN